MAFEVVHSAMSHFRAIIPQAIPKTMGIEHHLQQEIECKNNGMIRQHVREQEESEKKAAPLSRL